MAIEFYTTNTPNSQRVTIILKELGLAYVHHKIDIFAGEDKKPEFLKINPNGLLPLIKKALVSGLKSSERRVFERILVRMGANVTPADRRIDIGALRPHRKALAVLRAEEGPVTYRCRCGVIAAAVVAVFSVNAARANDTVQSLYEAAKKEGKVVLWTALDVSLHKRVAAKFNEKFPGIAVEAFKIFPGPAIERLITEAKSGRINVDIIDPNVAFLPNLFERGLVESYPYDKVFGINPQRLLFDRRGIVIGHYDIPVSYNVNLVAPGAIKSLDDLLDLKYRGRLLIEAHAYGLGILGVKWGEERMLDFTRRLVANRPTIVNSPTATAEALASGQGAIAFGAYAARVSLFKDQGAPIDWARVGPIPAQQVVSVPIKGGPNPNAAKLYAAFWATAEAQQIFYDEQRHGMVLGDGAHPRGKEIQQRGLEVVLELTDIEKGKHLLEAAAKTLGGINRRHEVRHRPAPLYAERDGIAGA